MVSFIASYENCSNELIPFEENKAVYIEIVISSCPEEYFSSF
jgi:hypothetical protein